MSGSANVELVRSIYADWERGNFLVDWNDFRAEAEEYRELDGERVLVLHHFGGRGKRSGAEVGLTGSKGASLFHVLDGRVAKLVLYPVRERALADLGLAPEGDAA